MAATRIYYPAEIVKEPDSDYGVVFPDFPGCISAGETMDEAIFNAHEALAGHVQLMLEDGDELPSPTPFEEAAAKRDETAVAIVPISLILPGKSRRVNITIDEALLEEIDSITNNRSRFLANAARSELLRRKAG